MSHDEKGSTPTDEVASGTVLRCPSGCPFIFTVDRCGAKSLDGTWNRTDDYYVPHFQAFNRETEAVCCIGCDVSMLAVLAPTDEADELRRKLAEAKARIEVLTEERQRYYTSNLQWDIWARRLTGAHDEPDTELRTTIEELVREPTKPWRERVSRLANIYQEQRFGGHGLAPDSVLWRMALEWAALHPDAITRALLAERLGVDPRAKTLSELLSMVGRAQ